MFLPYRSRLDRLSFGPWADTGADLLRQMLYRPRHKIEEHVGQDFASRAHIKRNSRLQS